MKLLSTLLLTSLVSHAQPVFIGTGDKAIYLSDFDSETGTLTEPTLAVEFKQPGFLALHPEKPVLCSIGGDSSVAGFSIGENNSLTLLGKTPSGGNGPCHLAVDASGRTLAVANYSSGTVSTIRLEADGKPGEVVSEIKIEGSGPNERRQKDPHPHGVYFDNANRFLFAVDLGADKTFTYKFDPATSEITPSETADFKSPPGSGPRHMAFSPDEKNAYIIHELLNTVSVASFNKNSGALTEVQTIPTLPEGFDGMNTTAEIEVHPNGNFVYGSNRGHDSIVVYKRDPEAGKLSFLQHVPCGGKVPRHFKIDPSGKWLICGHQDSNTISVLSLDPETGKLGEPQSTVKAPKPICILFQ